jgi:hypothetical protein
MPTLRWSHAWEVVGSTERGGSQDPTQEVGLGFGVGVDDGFPEVDDFAVLVGFGVEVGVGVAVGVSVGVGVVVLLSVGVLVLLELASLEPCRVKMSPDMDDVTLPDAASVVMVRPDETNRRKPVCSEPKNDWSCERLPFTVTTTGITTSPLDVTIGAVGVVGAGELVGAGVDVVAGAAAAAAPGAE